LPARVTIPEDKLFVVKSVCETAVFCVDWMATVVPVATRGMFTELTPAGRSSLWNRSAVTRPGRASFT